VNTRFDVPHSRWNDISRAQFEAAGLRVLVESEEVGVHLATSHDGLRMVFFQGHPEYDTISLLKEYKRDALLHVQGNLPSFPPFPEHYIARHEQAILLEWRDSLSHAARAGQALPEFPEAAGRRQSRQHLARQRRGRGRQLDGLHVSSHQRRPTPALHARRRPGEPPRAGLDRLTGRREIPACIQGFARRVIVA
jgi:hypothetical protein